MVFQHTRALGELIQSLHLDQPISAIGVSGFPRREEDSYMPAFLVGLNTAKSLGHCLQVPVHVFLIKRIIYGQPCVKLVKFQKGPF